MQQKDALTAEMLKAYEFVPDLYLILSPDLHILTASNAYLAATLSKRHEVVGKYVFDVFPDNPEVPQTNRVTYLKASLHEVLATGKPQQMGVQRYDVPRPPEIGGGFEEKYWQPLNTPVFDEQGEVLYIIHKLTDVTEAVTNRQHLRELTDKKAAWEQEKLQAMYLQAPVPIGIYEGKNHVIELVNPKMSEIMGRPAEEVLGKPLLEVFPEVKEQGFEHILAEVFASGIPYEAKEVPVSIIREGALTSGFYNIVYQPLRNDAQEITGILQISTEVSEQVTARQKTEEGEKQLRLITDALPVLIGYLDKEERYRFANKAYEEWFPFKATDLLGRTVKEVVGEKAYQGIKKYIDRALVGERLDYSIEMPYREGFTKYIHTTYIPDIQQGEVAGFYLLVNDVTPQAVARRKLEESEEKYRSLFETMDQGFCIMEMIFDAGNKPVDYRFIETNPTFEQQTGLKDARGKTARELVPSLENHWFEIYGNVALTGVSAHLTQGSEAMGRWFEIHAFRMGREGSHKVALLFTNITRQKEVEESLRRSNLWFQRVNEATQDAIWDWDLKTQDVHWNEGVYRMFRYKAGEVDQTASWWFEHVHPQDRNAVVNGIHEIIESGKEHWSAEYRFLTGDGGYKIVFDRGFVSHDEQGRPERMIGSMQDITERKRAEEALRESEARLRATVETTPDCIKIVDCEGAILFMNKAGLRMVEAESAARVKGSLVYNLIAPEYREPWKEMHDRICKGESLSWEFEMLGLKGTRRWMETHAVPLENPDGSLSQLAVARDISERKKAEEEKQKLITILEASQDFVGMGDLSGKITYLNTAALKMLGWDSWEGRSILDSIHPEDRSMAEEVLLPQLLNEGHFSKEIRLYNAKTGVPVWIIWNGITIKNPETGEKIALATLSPEITGRKQAEEVLKESEERFSRVIEGSNDGIWEWDFVNDTAWWNQRFTEILGVEVPEEERSFHTVNKYIHPDDRHLLPEALEAHLEQDKDFTVEYRIIRPSGEIRYVLSKGKGIKDELGNVQMISGTLTDFTDRRQVDENLRTKNEQLTRINNDLDNFIYTASHDLKAPILNIEGLVNLLITSFKPDTRNSEKVQSVVGMIHTSIGRFKETIKDLTEVAKVDSNAEEEVYEIDFADMLEEVKLNIKSLVDESEAAISADFSEAPTLYFSKKNLRSIVYNLVSNAIKYRSPDRPLRVDITTARTADGSVLLRVQDNGLGIKEKDKAKVFMMFKRLHQHVEGTGIGMAIVNKIIDNSGGKILLESEIGKGTVFTIYFKV